MESISVRKYKLAFLSFLGQFSCAMANFALIYFLRSKGYDSFEIGFSASLNPLFYFISCLIFQMVLKKRRAKLEISISTGGMALALALVLLSNHKALTYALLAFYGVFNSLLWSNVETWISQGQEGKALGSSVSLFNFSWSLGAGISTLVGGMLSAFSVSLPIVFVVFIFIFLAFFVLSIKKSDTEEEGLASALVEDNSTPLRFFCWIGITLLYIGYSLIITIFPLYALEVLGIGERRTGFLLLFRGLSACISFVIIGKLTFWHFNSLFIILIQLCFSIVISLIAIVKSEAVLALIFVLFGIIFAFIYELSIFHGATGASDRDKRMIIHEVLLTLGTIIGSLSGGYVYKYFSFQNIVSIIAISSFSIWCIELPFILRIRKSNK